MKNNPIPKEVYKKIAESNKIKIAQYDINMNLIEVHESAADLCRKNPEFSTGHISSCCKGKRKTHKGFIWKYYEGKIDQYKIFKELPKRKDITDADYQSVVDKTFFLNK